MKKVLILSCGTGGGHNSAALAIQESLKEKVVDISEPLFTNRFGKRIGIDGVEDICSNAYSLMGLSNYGYTTHTFL